MIHKLSWVGVSYTKISLEMKREFNNNKKESKWAKFECLQYFELESDEYRRVPAVTGAITDFVFLLFLQKCNGKMAA